MLLFFLACVIGGGSDDDDAGSDNATPQIEDESDWPDAMAAALCDAYASCYADDFEERYGGMEQCLEDEEDEAEQLAEEYEDLDCDFQPDEAEDCIAALGDWADTCDDAEFDEAQDACEAERVWDDCEIEP